MIPVLFLLGALSPDDGPGFDYGWEVALCGDLNGDCCSEIAVSAPRDNGGRVLVFDGATGRTIRVLEGGDPQAEFGERIVNLGDRNGNGVRDLGVSHAFHREERNPNGHRVQYLTEAYVAVFEGETGELLSRHRVFPEPEETLDAGLSVVADLAGTHAWRGGFGSPRSGYPLNRICRAAGDFRGNGMLRTAWLGKDGEVHIEGDERILVPHRPRLAIGTFLTSPGDLDDDGRADIVVASTAVSASRRWGPGPEGWVAAYSSNDFSLLWEHGGQGKLSNIGSALARAGDVDDDGVPDVLTSTDGVGYGRVICLSGRTGNVLVQTGDEFDHRLPEIGLHISGGEDVDGDGVPDFASGAFNQRCAGTGEQGALVFSGKDGSLIHDLSLNRAWSWWPPVK